MITDEQFELMIAHLAEPTQRENQSRGYLVVTWFMSAVVVNEKKCTTLAEVVEVTSEVEAAVQRSRRWLRGP